MRYGSVFCNQDRRHRAPGALLAFSNRIGNLTCLAKANANPVLTISNYDQRIESERATAFYDFRDAVDPYNPLLVPVLLHSVRPHDRPP